MSELPKCKLCDNYPENYHTGAFGVKHHCGDKHCTLHNVLFTEKQWRTLMGEPEPDMFWEYHNAEECYEDMDDLVAQYADYNMNFGEVAEIKIQCAKKMPNRRIEITTPSDEIDGTTWEWIE